MGPEVSPPASIMPGGSILIGRDAELAQLEAWSADPVAAPLIVTGPGGIGKTALIRAFVATRLDGRVVDCTACSSVDEVAIALATALDLDVVSARDRRLLARRAQALGVKLLAFDNLERLAPSSKELAPLFSIAPRSLATSRIALGLPGERTMVLSALATGDARAPAVELLRRRGFQEAGLSVAPEEEAMLEEIAVLADGIPLALELAATQIRMFGVRWTAEPARRDRRGARARRRTNVDRDVQGLVGSAPRARASRRRAPLGALGALLAQRGDADPRRGVALRGPAIVATLARHSWVVVDPRRAPRTSLDGAGEEPRFRFLVPLTLRVDDVCAGPSTVRFTTGPSPSSATIASTARITNAPSCQSESGSPTARSERGSQAPRDGSRRGGRVSPSDGCRPREEGSASPVAAGERPRPGAQRCGRAQDRRRAPRPRRRGCRSGVHPAA